MRSKYGLIVVWVVVLTSIFLGAYFLKFGNWPTSNDPGDWAEFATYLSGTVGVTAVVGTLFAFVVTLRQQQKLIDSQDKMIVKQERQIKVSETQLKNEKSSREVEFAYQASINIFPMLLKSIEKGFLVGGVGFYDTPSGSFSILINPLNRFSDSIIDNRRGLFVCNYSYIDRLRINMEIFESYKMVSFYKKSFSYSVLGFFEYGADKNKFQNMGRVNLSWLLKSRLVNYGDIVTSIHKVFKKVSDATLFVIDKTRVSSDLKGYLDICMDEFFEYSADSTSSDDEKVTYKFVALCYHAFLLGLGDKKLYAENIEILDFPENEGQLVKIKVDKAPPYYTRLLKCWYDTGYFLREKNLLSS